MGNVQRILENIWNIVINKIGIQSVLGRVQEDPLLGALHILYLIMWLIALFKLPIPGTKLKGTNRKATPSPLIGKTIGSLAIGLIGIAVIVMFAFMILYWIIGMATGMMMSPFGMIPTAIGGKIVRWIAGFFLSIAMMILPVIIGWKLLLKSGDLVTTVGEKLAKAMREWPDPDREDGVKLINQFAGCIVVAGMVNHPLIPLNVFYVETLDMKLPLLSILGCLLGVLALVFGTNKGQQAFDNKTAALKGEARQSDGATLCTNEGLDYVLDKNDEVVLDDSGQPKRKRRRCPGPQGKDENGIKYNRWTPRYARGCFGITCDQPNPCWQVCVSCGYGGDKDEKGRDLGFPRQPNKSVTCPMCGHLHPRLPKTTPFHTPDQDQSNPSTIVTRSPTKTPIVETIDGWRCQAEIVLYTSKGKKPKRDANNQIILVNGKPVVDTGTCGTTNAKKARKCSKCKQPKGSTSVVDLKGDRPQPVRQKAQRPARQAIDGNIARPGVFELVEERACPKCKAINASTNLGCRKCGEELPQADSPTKTTSTESLEALRKKRWRAKPQRARDSWRRVSS